MAVRRRVFRVVLNLLRSAAERVKEAEAEARRVSAENAGLRLALAKTLDLSIDTPVLAGGLGGRTAVEKYRRNVGHLVQVMNEAGNRALLYGPSAARFFLTSALKLDLEAIWAAPAATREEAERRDYLRYCLTATEELDLLSRPDALGERCRQRFISAVGGSGVDTSVQELVRRSPEVPEVAPHGGPNHTDPVDE